MNKLSELKARLVVIATAFATWLTVAVAALVELTNELHHWNVIIPEPYATWIARAIVIGGAVVLFIRNHTPVPPGQRGVLPPDGGFIGVGVLLRGVALVCLAVFTLLGFDWISADHAAGWLGAGLTLWLISTLAE